jgi:ubiquitin carboxyl-terminal hydrolase 8
MLDALHEDLNSNATKSKLRELTPEEEHHREKLPLPDVSQIEWGRYKHNHNSFLVELFQGQFISSLRCSVCSRTSTTCNAFMNLSVEISLPKSKKGVQLTRCIEAFVKEETLEGENAWNCPNCEKPQKASKQLRIARLPTILIIQLKRFHYEGPWRDKLDTFVDYPKHNLDLTPYVLNSEKSEKYLYDLYAVTNHFGTLSAGHCPPLQNAC